MTVWKKSMALAKITYPLIDNLNELKKFGMANQIERSIVSIPSNIAEGCSRSSEKEFRRFIQFSLGSSFELETQLLLCTSANLVNYEFSELLSQTTEIQKMLSKLNTILK